MVHIEGLIRVHPACTLVPQIVAADLAKQGAFGIYGTTLDANRIRVQLFRVVFPTLIIHIHPASILQLPIEI